MTRPRHILPGGAALVALAALAAAPVRADGAFLQGDFGRETASAVASVERGALAFGLSRADWADGHALNGSVTWKFPLDAFGRPVTLRAGPTVQYDDRGDWHAGLKLVAEHYAPQDWGGLFFLAELNSIKTGYFVMAQASHASGFGLELSAQGHDDGYNDGTLACSWRLPGTPVSLRLGHRVRADESFIGVSINTF